MKKIVAFPLWALGIFTLNAHAQTSDFVELIPTPYLQQDLTAAVGAGVVTFPKYADRSQQKIMPLPLVDLEWKSGVFFSTISGLGVNLSANPNWQYGVRLGVIANQDQSATNNQHGPGNAPSDISPALFGNYLVDQHYAILTSVQSGAGNEKNREGTLVSFGGRYFTRLDASNHIYAIVSTTWANGRYMQDYYGVTQAQSAQTKFPEYDTKAGILKTKLQMGWDYTINKEWSLLIDCALTHPLGDAGSSPLSSNKTQVIGTTAIYYKF